MLCAKNQQIAQLEAERRLLWDKICLLGIGAPVFSSMAAAPSSNAPEEKSLKPIRTLPPRPSTIMRRMDRLMEANWLKKMCSSNKSL